MSKPTCVVMGAGRIAGGFIAPVFSASDWRTILVGRDGEIVRAIQSCGGIWLRTGAGNDPGEWIGDVGALAINSPLLPATIAGAELLTTAVGPSALVTVGHTLAPLLRSRLDDTGKPVNIITFENHRRAPELLTVGLIEADPSLAREIGTRIGIGGAAVWRAVSRREATPRGVVFQADEVEICYIDGASLLPAIAPHNGVQCRLQLVSSFDDRMVEKLWVFNGGHAAAAYLGWLEGCKTLSEAMSRTAIRTQVAAVVNETRVAFESRLESRPGSVPFMPPPREWILERYSDPSLDDPVVRVGREPRRKLAPDDRLIGPALQCLADGHTPVALATAAAAALAYADPGDGQAMDLQRELELLGPEEVLATVSMLAPSEELTTLVAGKYRYLLARGGAR